MTILSRHALKLCVALLLIPAVTWAGGIRKYCDLVAGSYKEGGMDGVAMFVHGCYAYEISRRVVSRKDVEGCVVMDVFAHKLDLVFSEVYKIHQHPYFKELDLIKRTHEKLIESGVAKTSVETQKIYSRAIESVRSCD